MSVFLFVRVLFRMKALMGAYEMFFGWDGSDSVNTDNILWTREGGGHLGMHQGCSLHGARFPMTLWLFSTEEWHNPEKQEFLNGSLFLFHYCHANLLLWQQHFLPGINKVPLVKYLLDELSTFTNVPLGSMKYLNWVQLGLIINIFQDFKHILMSAWQINLYCP